MTARTLTGPGMVRGSVPTSLTHSGSRVLPCGSGSKRAGVVTTTPAAQGAGGRGWEPAVCRNQTEPHTPGEQGVEGCAWGETPAQPHVQGSKHPAHPSAAPGSPPCAEGSHEGKENTSHMVSKIGD